MEHGSRIFCQSQHQRAQRLSSVRELKEGRQAGKEIGVAGK